MSLTNQNQVIITSASIAEVNLQQILSFEAEVTDEDLVTHVVTEADFSPTEILRLKQAILDRLRSDIALVWNRNQPEE